MIPQDDSVGIRVTDEQEDMEFDGENIPMTRFENDIAIFKPKADLIVRGSYESGNDYAAHITAAGGSAQLWLHREEPVLPETLPDADAENNMFGWEQKAFSTRTALGDISVDVPPVDDTPAVFDYSNFDNLFFNAFRRDFSQTGFPLSEFSGGSRITLSKTPALSSDTETVLDFSLANERINANLFIHDGKSPDKPRYWCRKPLTDIHLDTLVVTPADATAYVLWRGIWDFNNYPVDGYRMLEVKIEELH